MHKLADLCGLMMTLGAVLRLWQLAIYPQGKSPDKENTSERE